jgi:hypothetical protein
MRGIWRSALVVAVGALLGGVLVAGPAAAEPETPVSVKTGSSATRATGAAFDACLTPPPRRCRPGWRRHTAP